MHYSRSKADIVVDEHRLKLHKINYEREELWRQKNSIKEAREEYIGLMQYNLNLIERFARLCPHSTAQAMVSTEQI